MRFGMTFIFERLHYGNSHPSLPAPRRYQEIPQKQRQCSVKVPMPLIENVTTRCMSSSSRNDVYRQYPAPKPPVCTDTPKSNGRGKRK
jgi:hypothetical protein